MVRLKITVSGSLLSSVRAEGHASGKSSREGNIMCAAVSVLLRTVAQLLERKPGVAIKGTGKYPGTMDLEVVTVEKEQEEWLQGVTDYLLFGLKTLESEYSDDLFLQIHKT